MRMHCIIHAEFERLGFFKVWAKEKGIILSKTHTAEGEKLPSLNEFDILLIMGGPQSPIEIDKYPYLTNEIELIKKAADSGKYIIGVCLGAQLISESFGAKTERSPHKEIGVFPLSLTEDGKQDSIFKHFPDHFPSAHWHNDMPGIPAGATVIAESQGCPRQIVRFSSTIYGFQCHLEFNKQCVEGLINNCPNDLLESTYVQTPDEIRSQNYEEINKYLRLFLQHFI